MECGRGNLGLISFFRWNSAYTLDLYSLICGPVMNVCWQVLILHRMMLVLTAQTMLPTVSTRIVLISSTLFLLHFSHLIVGSICELSYMSEIYYYGLWRFCKTFSALLFISCILS